MQRPEAPPPTFAMRRAYARQYWRPVVAVAAAAPKQVFRPSCPCAHKRAARVCEVLSRREQQTAHQAKVARMQNFRATLAPSAPNTLASRAFVGKDRCRRVDQAATGQTAPFFSKQLPPVTAINQTIEGSEDSFSFIVDFVPGAHRLRIGLAVLDSKNLGNAVKTERGRDAPPILVVHHVMKVFIQRACFLGNAAAEKNRGLVQSGFRRPPPDQVEPVVEKCLRADAGETIAADLLGVAEDNIAAGVGKYFPQASEQPGGIRVVRIEPADDFTPSCSKAFIDGMRLAAIALTDEPKVPVARRDIVRRVRRAVVEDDMLETRIVLIDDGINTTGKKRSLVP